MKPEKGLQDMEDREWHPRELFITIGMLIVEARLPEISAKGRVEGPHCSQFPGCDTHVCDETNPKCQEARKLQMQMDTLWRNRIPMCIELLLFPKCEHYKEDVLFIESSTGGPGRDEYLLERWDVQVIPKRYSEKSDDFVTGQFLIQAMRSYLFFSQLSSWLNSTGGSLPLTIAYRLFAPGESPPHVFHGDPEVHSFLPADLLHSTLRVAVSALPRLPAIPVLVYGENCGGHGHCSNRSGQSLKQERLRNRDAAVKRVPKDDRRNNAANVVENRARKLESSRHILPDSKSKAYLKRGRGNTMGGPPRDGCCFSVPVAGTVQLSMQISRPLARVERKELESKFVALSMKPEKSSVASRQVFKEKPLVFSVSTLSESSTGAGCFDRVERVDSPKVLLTTSCAVADHVFYGKGPAQGPSGGSIVGRLEGGMCNEEILDHAKPLTVEQIEKYLASLPACGTPASRAGKTCLENIPVTECKFYIGDCCAEQEDSKPGTPQEVSETATYPNILLTDSAVRCESTQRGGDCHNYANAESGERPVAHSRKEEPGPGKDETGYVQLPCSERLSGGIQSTPSQLCKQLQQECTGTKKEEGMMLDDSAYLRETDHLPPDKQKGSLCKSVLKKDFVQAFQNGNSGPCCAENAVPSMEDIIKFHTCLNKSASMVFNTSTGLPTQSSPAPIKKKSGQFDYDSSLTSIKAIKNALSCSKLALKSMAADDENENKENSQKILSTSAPASTNCLLGNFEESILNGRIEPSGVVEGFTAEIGASGSFCPKHVSLPVTAYFFSLSDDNAPSPYLGHINLETWSKKGYHIPKSGTVQVTLFNPNNTVVKMFVVMYDLADMPPNSQTFLRQRTLYMPVCSHQNESSYLRYLIHLRIASSRSGKLYLHTDVRLIFARDKFEYDARVANYELRSFTGGPKNPKFSLKR